jgi:hypothetical protein
MTFGYSLLIYFSIWQSSLIAKWDVLGEHLWFVTNLCVHLEINRDMLINRYLYIMHCHETCWKVWVYSQTVYTFTTRVTGSSGKDTEDQLPTHGCDSRRPARRYCTCQEVCSWWRNDISLIYRRYILSILHSYIFWTHWSTFQIHIIHFCTNVIWQNVGDKSWHLAIKSLKII